MNIQDESALQALGVMPSPDLDTSGCYLAFTLNGWTKKKIGPYEFQDLTPTEQKEYYCRVLKIVYDRLYPRVGFKKLKAHFEFTKREVLHTHGYVEIPERYYLNEAILIEFKKECHRLIGKRGLSANIAATIKWVNRGEIQEWYNYCSKNNSLPPHEIHYKGIQQWFISHKR